MKRFFLTVLAAALLLGAFTGCKRHAASSDATTPAPTAEPVTITVVTSFGGDDGNRGNYEAAIAGYEALTGNTVLDASATSSEEWKAKVATDFETGTEPAVLFYFTGSDASALIAAGKVVSIEEIRAQYPDYASNMKNELLPVSTVDGRAYAVPVNGFWEGMFVNRAVLQAAGVEMPGADYTWEQFLNDCRAIKRAGFVPVAVSLQEVPHYWFEFAVYNNGSSDDHLSRPSSSGDEVGMKWAAGLDDIKTLYKAGFLPDNTLTATDAETVRLLAEGKAAFLVAGNWQIGYFQENCADHLEDFALTYVPGKGERAATDLIGGISMGYYITRKAWENPAKREAALSFIEYMTSDEQVSIFSATAVTALKNGVTPAAGLDALQVSAIEMCAGATAVVAAVQDRLTPEQRGALFTNIKNVVTGAVTAAEAIDRALAK